MDTDRDGGPPSVSICGFTTFAFSHFRAFAFSIQSLLCVLCASAVRSFPLIVLAALGCRGPGTVPAGSAAATAVPAARGPVTFADVTQAAGVRFTHVNGGSGHRYMPETMGSGCAFLDVDGDD